MFLKFLIFFIVQNGDPSKTNEFEQTPLFFPPGRYPRDGPMKSKVNAMIFLRGGMKLLCFQKPLKNQWFSIDFRWKFDSKFLQNVERFGDSESGARGFSMVLRGSNIEDILQNSIIRVVVFSRHFDHRSNGFWRFFCDYEIDLFRLVRKNGRFLLDRCPFFDVNVVNAISFCIFFKKTSWSHLAQSGFSSGCT